MVRAWTGQAAGDKNIGFVHHRARLNGKLHGTAIVFLELILDTGIAQAMAMGGKGVGDDDLGTVANVVQVNFAHDFGVAERAAPIPGMFDLGNTAPLNLGACGAINHDALAGIDTLHQFFVAVHFHFLQRCVWLSLSAGINRS